MVKKKKKRTNLIAIANSVDAIFLRDPTRGATSKPEQKESPTPFIIRTGQLLSLLDRINTSLSSLKTYKKYIIFFQDSLNECIK